MYMDNYDVARILEEVGTLLQFKGDNPFRSRAYIEAARSMRSYGGDLAETARSGRLREIRGIGPSIEQNIIELIRTGQLPLHRELRNPYPPGFMEMLELPGLGPKKMSILWRELGVGSLEDLERAVGEGRLGALEGFDPKAQEQIAKALEFRRMGAGFHLARGAACDADALASALSGCPDIRRISLAGSVRRRSELVRNINLVAASEKPGAVVKWFSGLNYVQRIVGSGAAGSSVVLQSGIDARLDVVPEAEFPYALRHATGSAAHNAAIRDLAARRGLELNEHGLFKGQEPVRCGEEPEIYGALGLSYIPPELREGAGEIEAAEKGVLPVLVEDDDIRGAVHIHTSWSDGTDSLEDLVRAAAALGFEYVGISDHSQSAFYASGIAERDLLRQHEEVARIQANYPQIRILKGIESDILKDGALDYSADVLKSFDFVIASIHTRFRMKEAEMTARVVRALENPHTTILAHPTGRLLLSREPFALDLDKVVDAAITNGVAIEINSHPERLDLDWRFARRAAKRGALFSIDPDAHSVRGLADIRFGVGVARKAWLSAGQVLNTRSVHGFLDFAHKSTRR
jgi:DNA polymerase (family X)